jgi:hypothetical protein
MNNSRKKQSTKPGFTIIIDPDKVPVRVLEQCLRMRALLATLLSIQTDLYFAPNEYRS